MPPLEIVHQRTPKFLQVDESGIMSLEGKLPNWTIHYQYFKIIKKYFKSKFDASKYKLSFSLLKSRSLTVARIILGIKTIKGLETSNHIAKILVDAFQKLGRKTCSKDHNVAQHVLS